MIKAAALFAVGFSLGCGTVNGPLDRLSHAVATFTCGGPLDRPGTVIVLAREPIGGSELPRPSVGIVIWRGVRELPGGSFRIGEAFARYETRTHLSQFATAGRVTIDSVAADLTVYGVADLTFSSARFVSEFSAEWRQSLSMCG